MQIALLENLMIGGSEQWVLERSEDLANPIVLFVHGGPGTSQLTSNRRNTRDLERWFTVVNWDQRGAGKSYPAIRDTDAMNIGQFVDDAHELTLHLLEKFGKERLVLVGHSWGSVVGALAVARFPELYSCYVGIGQVANMAEGEALSYQWALDQARERRNRRAIRSLERIGPPPYTGDWRKKTITERAHVARFGGEVHSEGRHDWEVPSILSARYFDALRAPSKRLVWFESSAHLPNAEEPDRFNQVMREEVRPLALADA